MGYRGNDSNTTITERLGYLIVPVTTIQKHAKAEAIHIKDRLVRDTNISFEGNAQLELSVEYQKFDEVSDKGRSVKTRGVNLKSKKGTYTGTAAHGKAQSLRRLPSADSHHSQDGKIGVLTVRIIRAKNLVNMDSGWFGDVSDPYVKVTLGKTSKRTHTIDNNLDPEWNASPMLFDVRSMHEDLKIEVFDEDMGINLIKGDDPLGDITVPLSKIPLDSPILIKDNLQNIEHGKIEVELALTMDDGVRRRQLSHGDRASSGEHLDGRGELLSPHHGRRVGH